MRRTLITGALGALVMYLFDPQHGRTRRAKLQDQMTAVFRRGAREAVRKTDYAGGQLQGVRQAAPGIRSSEPPPPPPNDETLTAKVESEILGRSEYPKGSINVNSVGGVVELRGTCDSAELIDELEQEVRKISGVVDVHNYLHPPNTPAPNK